MRWLQLFMQLLPTVVVGVEQVGSLWQGHQKKAAAIATMSALAQGVATISPEHGEAAHVAAQTASTAIDGVVATLNEIGKLQHKDAPTATAAPTPTLVPLAQVPASVADAPSDELAAEPGPGLHTVVPA